MTAVLLGLGSNLNRYANICAALDALQEHFGPLQVSRVFESEAVGVRADNYFNLVVALDSPLPLAALSAWLKSLEDSVGRERGQRRCEQPLDIDILCFGDSVGFFNGIQIPRAEILKNAFVLRPLAEMVPEWLHPEEQVSFAELWRAYRSEQKLWPIAFEWDGRPISMPDTAGPDQASGD
ncbi:2-amino-4-hydroxy-6-hydroxymethyldihydropteridine pyrophosphokinase [Marinobacterium zhoushanense]|uniref:2-amino-4-hydroxy-6-hydroxymethyldihydropteridine diphosphokinase n=1 Tax=Marinobacterium zhoushanense TaxID=1679163 RepID=A0ABQ1KPM4_9GAMM|nr:2-amino-4-hydroxy-6-hydroxymethyldihydropteridine diphosphokinase [Marinobacterium zhoushanense]GGC06562.1 2-amino-4-hydroxy-6-hydroxymethyldihydropteridine pyrophosphokinase [Marinobacterium zhoushanense]